MKHLCSSTLLGLGVVVSAAVTVAAERPNIVLIIADNQSAELIGAYGNEHIRTPNIDRLAAEGILFENAYSVSGTCSPTRATMLTGLLPSQTGVHMALQAHVGIDNWSAVEEFRNLPQTLHDAGYRTGLIGKYHLGNSDRAQLKFDTWITFKGGHTTTFYDEEVIDHDRRYKVKGHLTDFWTEKAIDFINTSTESTNRDKPFFLMLSYNGPYMLPPTVTMEPRGPYAAHYRENIPPFPREPVHPYLQNWAKTDKPSARRIKAGTTAWSAINALNNRTAMINTAAETSYVDEGVGRVVAAIESRRIERDTLIVYTSDQGSAFGHHGLWGNTSWSFPFQVYDINVHIPLIMRHVGKIKDKQRSKIIVNQFDLFPTLLAYSGLGDFEIANSPGKSFVHKIKGDEGDWQDEAFFEFVTVRGIRTPRWKYTKNMETGVGPTLYDLEQDPGELNNLASDPKYAGIMNRLNKRVDAFFEQYAAPAYDVWHGGTAKGRLLEGAYGRDDIFRDRFKDWRPPYIEKAQPFTDI